ncbi:MAG: hypothetical protein ACTSWZ_07785 [Candidatus Heimdallarchaeaceae archaeon]
MKKILIFAPILAIFMILLGIYLYYSSPEAPPPMRALRFAVTCPPGCEVYGTDCDICGSTKVDDYCPGYYPAGYTWYAGSWQRVHVIIYDGSGCTGNIIASQWIMEGESWSTTKAGYNRLVIWECNNCVVSCKTPCCGNGVCESGENYYNCPQDCPMPCTDECSYSGQTRCKDAYTKQTCGNWDADPCLEWGNDQYCQYGCVNGQCVTGEVRGEIYLVFLGIMGSILGILGLLKLIGVL